ncbi:hypothetical protein DPV78_002278 [Talaromyces pinophilus]|nr:hypothetical protein DPV78_002278 [Talaromyces pinophilus]
MFKARSAIRFGGNKENKYELCGVVPDVMQDETDFTAQQDQGKIQIDRSRIHWAEASLTDGR